MAPRPKPAKKAAARKSPPRKRPATRKKAAAKRSASQRPTGEKPAKKAAAKRAPAKKSAAKKASAKRSETSSRETEPGVVESSVTAFLADAELTGGATVQASLALELARKIDHLPTVLTPSLAGLSKELRESLGGIMRKDDADHDDWTTRLGSAEDRD